MGAMADTRSARIVLDAAGRVKDADSLAREFTAGRALRGADHREVLPPAVGQSVVCLPARESCPASACGLSSDGPAAWLWHYAYDGDDLVCRFQPLLWSMTLAESLASLVFVTGAGATVVYANPALTGHLRRAPVLAGPEDFFSRVIASLGMAPQLATHMHARALLGETSTCDGEAGSGPLQVETTPLRYFGRACGALWVARKATMPGFTDRPALAALAWRLAATYQHELRNPLQTIQAAVSLLRQGGDHVDRDALLEVIERNTVVISEAVDGHLPPTQAPGPFAPVMLSAIVTEAMGDARRRCSTRALTFIHDVDGAEPAVHCPSAGLARSFASIFRNAAEARADARVRVFYRWDERQVVCQVDDDGPGFPPEALALRLQPCDPVGRLGLALVAATAEAAGGGVALGVATGGGARISLWLPRVAGAPADAPGPAL